MENSLEDLKSVILIDKDLWFLISQFSPVTLLGIKNPYVGWEYEEVLEANRRAVLSLVNKNLAHILSEDSVEVDNALVEMVHTCAVPKHSLLIQTRSDSDYEQQRYIQFREEWIVEHIQESNYQHRLTAFKDCESLCNYLGKYLCSSSPVAGHGKPFFLSEEILFIACQSYAEGQDDEGLAALGTAKLHKETMARLAATLADPVANASFTFIMNMQDENTQYVKGFGLLEGKEDFWMLSPCERSGQHLVEFIPASADLVHRRFIDMLPA